MTSLLICMREIETEVDVDEWEWRHRHATCYGIRLATDQLCTELYNNYLIARNN